jgi:hypothetical protein
LRRLSVKARERRNIRIFRIFAPEAEGDESASKM